MTGPLTENSLNVRLSVQRLGDELLATVAGELDLASAPVVISALGEQISACRRLVIDASGVRFVDAAGLQALAGGPTGWGGRVDILVRTPSVPMRRLLELAQPTWLGDESGVSRTGGGGRTRAVG